MTELHCGCCGAKLQPLNGPGAASGETWAHPIAACPWSEWEGLTTPQVNALGQIIALKTLATKLAGDLEYLAARTEIDDAVRNHIQMMQLQISETISEAKLEVE